MNASPDAAAREIYLAEPPAQYLARPALVLDCSVLCAVLFSEPQRDEALRRMAEHTLHAPTLLLYEIASVAVKKLLLGWPIESINAAVDMVQQQAIVLHPVELRAQCFLAQKYRLSAYDAAYLWLAAELKAPLTTFDAKLGKAAKTHLGGLT